MFGCGWKSAPLLPLFPISGCVTERLITKPFKMVIQQEGSPLNVGKTPPGYGIVEIGEGAHPKSLEEKGCNKKLWVYSLPSIGFITVAVAMVLVFAFTSFNTPATTQAILKATGEGAVEGNKHVDLESTQGQIRGYIRNTRQGREYIAFYKVPYAKPPLGNLRFIDAQPVESWEGLRDVKEVAPQCIQKEKYSDIIETHGLEDCLYMNIYTPSVQTKAAYPTMVYIHGGGFTDGNGSRYGAEYFMDEDVVLITFQYRLGSLAFLNSEDGVFPGNLAFKDQVMVLRWVKDNVAPYGGDPSRVTIYGNSAGAMSVSFLMVSPLTKDLFHQSVTQSGANICESMGALTNSNPIQTVLDVAKELNCSTDTSTQLILECLRTKPAEEIAVVRTPNTVYALSIDSNSSSPFMPDTPFNLLKNKKANQVPNIIGITSAEWVGTALDLLQNTDLIRNLNENWSEYAENVVSVGDMTKEELDSIKTFYFGNKPIGNETIVNLTNLASDRALIHCSYLSAVMHGEMSNTFLYYLSKPPAKSYAEKTDPNFNASAYGFVAHADELQFQFLYYEYPEILVGDPNYYSFSEYFVGLWAYFAENGSPSGMDGLEWKPTTSKDNVFWFELNDNPGETHVLDERMRFWDQFSTTQLKYE